MIPFRPQLNTLNVALLYLLTCQAFGLATGLGPAVAAALLSFLAFDFFFIPPYLTLSVDGEHHVLALVAFLLVALMASQLMARVRQRTRDAVREQRRSTLLYELNAALVHDVSLDAILASIAERAVLIYGSASCRLIVPDANGPPRVVARFPATAPLAIERGNQAVAHWVMERRSPAGRGWAGRRLHHPTRRGADDPIVNPPAAGADVLYLPVATTERVIGVLEVTGRPGGGRFRQEDEQLLSSFADQAALALERARLTEEAARVTALEQSDELKSALLAAVSHDLRTPLASIKAAATALLDTSVAWSTEDRAELLDAIDQETDRLTKMVGDLLDLSRIEGAALRPDKAWYDIAELVGDVARRYQGRAGNHRLALDVEPDLPMVEVDYVEIAQVLVNLVENAMTYTPLGTPITICARRATDAGRPAIELSVADEGPGIPRERQGRLFDKFYRGDPPSQSPGTGIGLTISKGFVEAHGGRIWVESDEGAGATFRFTLPLRAPDVVPDASGAAT